jgi:hypothetical protein
VCRGALDIHVYLTFSQTEVIAACLQSVVLVWWWLGVGMGPLFLSEIEPTTTQHFITNAQLQKTFTRFSK